MLDMPEEHRMLQDLVAKFVEEVQGTWPVGARCP
jgi:hypothetical protein